MPRVNFYQSAFNLQKEKLNILAEMLESHYRAPVGANNMMSDDETSRG